MSVQIDRLGRFSNVQRALRNNPSKGKGNFKHQTCDIKIRYNIIMIYLPYNYTKSMFVYIYGSRPRGLVKYTSKE